jgi:hypothetical protein
MADSSGKGVVLGDLYGTNYRLIFIPSPSESEKVSNNASLLSYSFTVLPLLALDFD